MTTIAISSWERRRREFIGGECAIVWQWADARNACRLPLDTPSQASPPGWSIVPPAADRRLRAVQASLFAAVAAAPDLDLLIGRHRAESHSLGAAAIVATIAAWRRWPVADTRGRVWLAIFAACATHPLLDALAFDNVPPIGIMAFWPFSRAYVQSGFTLFAPVWRRWWLASFYTHNTLAVIREVSILAPVWLAVWWMRGKGRRQKAQGTSVEPV